jgi:hypothetical protein
MLNLMGPLAPIRISALELGPHIFESKHQDILLRGQIVLEETHSKIDFNLL